MFTHRMNKTRSSLSILLLLLTFGLLLLTSVPVFGQFFHPRKDLVFTQVIASPTFESVIAVTNRGPNDFLGEFLLYNGTDGSIWNPQVNGEAVVNGGFDITIPSNSTKIFSIADNTFVVGYVIIYASDLQANNNLEGNLTYYNLGTSVLLDAVGVPSSKEFFEVSLPFNNFNNVGLSLASPPFGPATDAEVSVFLYDDDGNVVTATGYITILDGGHYARYLNELPWADSTVTLAGQPGKVMIRSSKAISGIAMTVTPDGQDSAQISTLPLEGTPVLYILNALETSTNSFEGQLSLWFEGIFARGYLVIKAINGAVVASQQTWLVNGQLSNGTLKLTFPCYLGDPASVPELSLYLKFKEFSPFAIDVTGTWRGDLVDYESVPVHGTVSLHREN